MKAVVTLGKGRGLCILPKGRDYCVVAKGREVLGLGLPGPGKVYSDLGSYTYNDLNMTFNQVDQTL